MKKEERDACWKAKDELFACLEKSNEDLGQCEMEHRKLKELCPKSWVKRFIGKRKFDREKENIIKEWGDQQARENLEKVRNYRKMKKEQEKQEDEFDIKTATKSSNKENNE
ncbi:hypothetical protein ABK040_002622 [Willaertia magna]